MGSISLFLQHLANGISLGSLYALIAIGYTMVYGILRLINFAHGDIFMLGVYLLRCSIPAFLGGWYSPSLQQLQGWLVSCSKQWRINRSGNHPGLPS